MTRSSFPNIVAMAGVAALLTLAPEPAAAQGPAPTLRVAIESAFERVAETAASTSVGVSRLHADASTQRASRRSKVNLWSGVTAEQPWLQTAQGSLAGAANADGEVTLSRRNSLTFSQQVSSAPTDVFAVLGSGMAAPASRAVLSGSELADAQRMTSEGGSVGLSRILDAKLRVLIAGSQSFAMIGRDRVASGGVSARMSRRVGGKAAWHVGYGFTESRTRTGGSTLEDQRHDVDAGIDYARPLSFWGHTTMSVTTGSTLLATADGTDFRPNVTAELKHQLSTQTSVTANYSRPIDYVPGFTHALVSDAVRVGFSGQLPGRMSLHVSAGAAWGTEERVAGARFASYSGAVQV